MDDVTQALQEAGRLHRTETAHRAATRFTTEAADAADVAYGTVESPVGPLLAVMSRRGVVALLFVRGDEDRVLERVAHEVSPRILEVPTRIDPVRRELNEYFEGDRRQFDVPVDWSLSHGFGRKVLQATNRIPFGSTSTYKAVAGKAGSEQGARAAGNALGANPIPIVVPCHRVLPAGGGLGGYGGGPATKEFLLRLEGAWGDGRLL
jgi:methylated-DNA-[protein]-cysteine S-methyltransferase